MLVRLALAAVVSRPLVPAAESFVETDSSLQLVASAKLWAEHEVECQLQNKISFQTGQVRGCSASLRAKLVIGTR